MVSAPGSESAFLHCLSQLNDDAWAEVLLPKLVEQGSTAALASTCSQLRQLCSTTVQHLDLRDMTTLLDRPDAFSYIIDAHCTLDTAKDLAGRFPNCKSAALDLFDDASYYHMHTVLSALARCDLRGHNILLPASFELGLNTLLAAAQAMLNMGCKVGCRGTTPAITPTIMPAAHAAELIGWSACQQCCVSTCVKDLQGHKHHVQDTSFPHVSKR